MVGDLHQLTRSVDGVVMSHSERNIEQSNLDMSMAEDVESGKGTSRRPRSKEVEDDAQSQDSAEEFPGLMPW